MADTSTHPNSVALYPDVFARLVNDAIEQINPQDHADFAELEAHIVVRVDEILRAALRLDELPKDALF